MDLACTRGTGNSLETTTLPKFQLAVRNIFLVCIFKITTFILIFVPAGLQDNLLISLCAHFL